VTSSFRSHNIIFIEIYVKWCFYFNWSAYCRGRALGALSATNHNTPHDDASVRASESSTCSDCSSRWRLPSIFASAPC